MFRQWTLVFTVSLSLSLATHVVAGGGEFGQVGTYTPPHYIEGTCIVNPFDPFDPNARLPQGPHRGACIDSRERRSAIRISDPILRHRHFPNAAPQDEILANVYHDNEFWIAHIPASAFSQAILQVQYFPLSPLNLSHIAHTQILLRLKRDSKITLIQQAPMPGMELRETQLSEIIISIEVVGEKGPAFNALKGVRDYYVQAYRLVSLEEKIEWMITKQNHRVKQWALNLSSDEVAEIFQNFVSVASNAGLTTPYHTFHANCSNLLAQLVSGYGKNPGWMIRALESVSNLLPLTFKVRKILGVRLPDLNDEILHQSTQAPQ